MSVDCFYDKLDMFDYWVKKVKNEDPLWGNRIVKIEEDETTKFSSEPRIKIYVRGINE